jgi:ABC-type nitrate/sulfonate/bicarbonate transport system substrate-binding protein
MLRREFALNGLAAGAAGLALASCTASKPAAQDINIVSTSGTTNLVLTALLNDLGYLTELGVKPNFINVADGNKVVAALISGDVDLCPAAGFTQVLAAIARGAPLRIVGGASDKNFNAVFSNNTEVKTLKDLEGRTAGVGALGSQLHQTFIALFRKYGVDATKVKFVNVGSSTDVFKAVIAKVVDAGPAEVWSLGDTGLHILENGKTFESLPEFVNQAAFASQKAITQKREVMTKTLAAYAKLYRFIMTGDSEAAFMAASVKALGDKASDMAKAQYDFYRQFQPFAASLMLDEPRVKFMQELNVTTGTQKEVLPYTNMVDITLAQDAIKLIG